MYEEVVSEGPWLFFAVKARPVLVLMIMLFPGAFAGCSIGANHLGGWGGLVAFASIVFGSPTCRVGWHGFCMESRGRLISV